MTAPSRTQIPWHRRLEARVLVAATLIAGLSLAAVLYAASGIVRRYATQQSVEDLDAAHEAFTRLIDSRASFAAAQTRLIAELPVFRAHIDPSSLIGEDTATISAMAEDYRSKLAADFCIVTDGGGRWISDPGWTWGVGARGGVTGAIDSARAGRSGREISPIGDGVYLTVSQPGMFSDEVLGTITAGYKLDDRVAQELARVTHTQVSLVCGGNRVCGSSLPADTRADLAGALALDAGSLGAIGGRPDLRQIGRLRYVSAVYPLLAADTRGERGQLVLLRAWSPTQQAIDQMQKRFLLIGVLTLATALAGTLIVSRRLTRPLTALAAAANEISTGNWTQQVPADRGTAEARIMAAAFNDMTGRLSHLHHEATQRSELLQESYDRFRTVTDSANDAIVSVDREGHIVFWNRRAQSVFGYTEIEAIGQNLSVIIAESDGEVRRYLSAVDDRWLGRTIELTGRRRDGTLVPLEFSLSTWKSGADMFFTAVIRDITERRQAEEALRQREEQLRQAQKMEAVGRLAGGIAHDFNNLLTAILGYADFLYADVPSALRADVDGIRKAARSAATMTRQLLAFSRRQVLQPQVLDLNAVVGSTDKLLRRLIGADVELTMTLGPDLPAVRADPGQIEQIVLNLAVNARDAMPEGGRLAIGTSIEPVAVAVVGGAMPIAAGFSVVLTVSDTGSGMSDEVRSHIFEPFYTTKEVGKGTGLGLATVYGIVQQSGGYIE
ncbi:MAG: PAS domain S-box protein, partial [Acidobacteriota bacterium]